MIPEEVLQAVREMREGWKKGDDARDAGLPHVYEGVKRIDNLQYGADPEFNLLDLYLPTKVEGKLPILIQIHGGGWVYGTKETYQYYGMGMAQRGFAFVNPSYVRGPEAQYPAELDQVDQYIHWVADHADEYNLDKNNVFLVGDSAGGQMAEQYATILTNPDYRAKFGYTLTDLHFRAVLLNSPATFMLDPGMIAGGPRAYFTDEVLADEHLKETLNVEKYITEAYLPTFISTANEDFIHDCAVRLDGFLRAKGIEVVQKSYGDADHPEPHVFLINQKDDIAKQANDEEAEFLVKHLVK